MSSLKYATLIDGRIDSVSYDPDCDEEGNVLPPWILIPDDVYAGYSAGPNNTWIPPEVEPPVQIDQSAMQPVLVGLAQLAVNNGEVSSLSLTSQFTAAVQMGVGELWIFFRETQPDSDYLVLVYPTATAIGQVIPSNKFEDFFIINVTDFNGNPADVDRLSFEVKRVG